MFGRLRPLATTRLARHALAAALVCVGAGACKGGGSSPSAPTPPGASASVSSCRTFATSTRSVQTFVDGQVVTVDSNCTLNGAEATCNLDYLDSFGGPGSGTQTTRFASRSDIVDEAAVNPPRPLALETTTVMTISGVSFTTKATNTYDGQRRLMRTTIDNPPPLLGQSTLAFTAWDAASRPTTGTLTLSIGPSSPISYIYDSTARTVRRDTGLNVCTQTYDQNGNIIGETCTGTTPSTTVVTIRGTTQLCK